MEAVAKDVDTQKWWEMTDGMQESLVEGATSSGGKTGWWLDLKEVFRFEGERQVTQAEDKEGTKSETRE